MSVKRKGGNSSEPLLLNDGGLDPDVEAKEADDPYSAVYWIFFLQGAGTLFPWNVFITANAFFENRFQGTSYESNFQNWFGITYNLANVLVLSYVLCYGHLYSLRHRILIPLVVNAVVFLTVTALVMVEDFNGESLFGVIIVLVSVAGGMTASLSGALFATTARFPGIYTSALLSGQGLSGAMVAIFNILTLLGSSASDEDISPYEDVRDPAFAYFLIATGVLVACVVSYFFLEKLPFFQLHTAVMPAMTSKESELLSLDCEKEGSSLDLGLVKTVFRIIRMLAFDVFLGFAITLAIFPSVTASIDSVTTSAEGGSGAWDFKERFTRDLFIPFSFLTFNVFDFVGRFSAGFAGHLIPPDKLVYFVSARLIFFPLFMLCNVEQDGDFDGDTEDTEDTLLPVLFNNDAWPIIFMVLFAASNGFLSSCAMIAAPSKVSAEQQSTAGTIMIFFLTCGLTAGSFLSFAVRALICECNPFAA